jgi:hypothetical protein
VHASTSAPRPSPTRPVLVTSPEGRKRQSTNRAAGRRAPWVGPLGSYTAIVAAPLLRRVGPAPCDAGSPSL